jgi:hypothetical protein
MDDFIEIALVGIGVDAFIVSVLYYFYKKGSRMLKHVKVMSIKQLIKFNIFQYVFFKLEIRTRQRWTSPNFR